VLGKHAQIQPIGGLPINLDRWLTSLISLVAIAVIVWLIGRAALVKNDEE
jgi:hypothetical protein